jgi:hypothetical protein
MTNQRIWESLVSFLSSLGGNDPVSMMHDTPSYMPSVENYLKNPEANDDFNKTSYYLGVFLGEYINQVYSGYWKHEENESVIVVGPDEDGLVYKTSPNKIAIEKSTEMKTFVINPFKLAKAYLNTTNDVGLSEYVKSQIRPKA